MSDVEEEQGFIHASPTRKAIIIFFYALSLIIILICIPLSVIWLGKLIDIVESDSNLIPTLSPTNSTLDVYIVYKNVMNFTDASESCAHFYRAGQLMFPKTLKEEEELKFYFLIAFNDVSKVVDSAVHPCGSQYFIGMRKKLDHDWETTDKQIMFGPPLSSNIYSKSFAYSHWECSHLLVDEDFLIDTRECESNEWQCFLCQHLDPVWANLTYYVYRSNFVKSYRQAYDFCSAHGRGYLASVPHISVVRKIKNALTLLTKQCKTIGIGNRLLRKYENKDHEEQEYTTKSISYPREKYLDRNCVVIDTDDNFVWKLVDCSEKHCFVCQN